MSRNPGEQAKPPCARAEIQHRQRHAKRQEKTKPASFVCLSVCIPSLLLLPNPSAHESSDPAHQPLCGSGGAQPASSTPPTLHPLPRPLTPRSHPNSRRSRCRCCRPVSHPNSLSYYHFFQRRAYLNPEFAALVAAETEAEMEALQPAPASKPATSSKPRKKKPGHDFGATEGFYYYAGFGPCRSKRRCRSSSMNESVPPKKEEAEDGSPANEQAQVADDDTIQQPAGRDGKSSCEVIAGVDEESSDDQYELGSSGRGMNYGSGEHRVGNFDGKMNKGWKPRRRKPVKARPLK